MAFNKKELEIIEWGKTNGKSSFEIMQALSNMRDRDKNKKIYREAEGLSPKENVKRKLEMGPPPSSIAGPREMLQDLKKVPGEVMSGIRGAAEERRQIAEETGEQKDNRMFSLGTQAPSAAIEGAMAGVGSLIVAGGKVILSKEGEDRFKQNFDETIAPIAGNKVVQNINNKMQDMRANDPQMYSNVRSALTFAELGLEVMTAGIFGKVVDKSIEGATKARPRYYKDGTEVTPFLDDSTSFANPDDVIETAIRKQEELEGTAGLRAASEAQRPGLSLTERWIGLREDQKRRLYGNEELLADYINISKTRNNGDFVYDADGNKTPVPSPLGFGAQRVETAYEILNQKLNDSGSFIGQTRQKLATTNIDNQAIEEMEEAFTNELFKLNLGIRNGQITPISGRNPLTSAEGDIRVLQDLYQKMQVVKQSPNLQNYYEFRSILDSTVNWKKSAQEASNSVDGISRSVRTSIRDNTNRLLGDEYATQLEAYSNYMDAYKELESYTQRRAGSEYLLRLLDSGRSREADELIQTIADYSGIDLKDDATIITLVTDMFGNASQKTRFQQEIQKLGVDIAGAAAGSPLSIGSLLERGGRALLDEEKILKRISREEDPGMPISPEAAGGATVGAAAVLMDEEEWAAPLVGVAAMAQPQTRGLLLDSVKNAFKQSEHIDDFVKRLDNIPEMKGVPKEAREEIYDNLNQGRAPDSFNQGGIPQTTSLPPRPPSDVYKKINDMQEEANAKWSESSGYGVRGTPRSYVLEREAISLQREIDELMSNYDYYSPAEFDVDFEKSSSNVISQIKKRSKELDELHKNDVPRTVGNNSKYGIGWDTVPPKLDTYATGEELEAFSKYFFEDRTPDGELGRTLDGIVEKAPPLKNPKIFHRGMRLNPEEVEKIKSSINSGGIYSMTFERPQSWSDGVSTAWDFARDKGNRAKIEGVPILLEVAFQKGTKGARTAFMMDETLFGSNTSIVFDKITPYRNGFKITGKQTRDQSSTNSFNEGEIPSTTDLPNTNGSNLSIMDSLLEGWVTRDISERAPDFTPEKIKELEQAFSQFPKPTEPITLYRVGDMGGNRLTSWTTNEETIEMFAERNRELGLNSQIIERTVSPDEILVSLNDLPEDLKKRYRVIEEEEEYILKPLSD